jgi:hypothetical protein
MKKLFLAMAVLVAAVAIFFVRGRLFVDQQFGPSSMLALAVLSAAFIVLLASYFLSDGKHRDRVIGFWLVSASTVIAYVILDLAAGHFLITPLSPQLVPDPVRHHKLVPNAHAKFQQKDFSYVQRNNKFGLRGAEIDLDKPDATIRILMLGDSFTMGKGVEDDETFSHLLEQRLNQRTRSCRSGGQKVEVLNAGVDSYTPLLGYLYLSNELADFSPDFIFYNLDNSDLVQEAAYRAASIKDEAGAIIAVPGRQSERSISEKFRYWIENNLYITRLVLYYTNKWMGHKDLTVRGVVERANAEILAHTLTKDNEDRSLQWEKILDSLSLINEFAEGNGAGFVVSVYPWAHQVSDSEWTEGRGTFLEPGDTAIFDYDKIILDRLNASEIPAFSLYGSFRNYEGDEQLYFESDMHFTVKGHRVMAEGIMRYLENEGDSIFACQ